MKTLLLTAVFALAALQLAPPPAPLNAAQCKCSIEVTVKHAGTGNPIEGVEVTLTQQNSLRSSANVATIAALTANLPANVNIDIADLLNSVNQAAATAGAASNTAPYIVTATTDSSGRVLFRDLAEGTYLIRAVRDGYFGSDNSSDTFPTQVNALVPVGPAINPPVTPSPTPQPGVTVVPPNQSALQITLNMVQGSTISGRIYDSNRRPSIAAEVGAYRVSYRNGQRVLSEVGTAAQTNDRGEYRLFWLPPGEYYIRIGATIASARSAPVRRGGIYSDATYYPGTSDPKSAMTITIREGSDRTGVDIGLTSVTGVTVSGTIINTIPGGRSGRSGQTNRSVGSISLVPRNTPFFEMLPFIGGAVRAVGGGNPPNDSEVGFEIHGVPPGTYDFYPLFNDGSSAANGGANYYTARTPIEVGSVDVTGIQSVIKPGATLKGRVTVTGSSPTSGRGQSAQPINLANMRIQLQPKDNIPTLAKLSSNRPAALDADGTFTMANLVDAPYFISGVTPLPVDAYVADIRQDSHSVFDSGILTIGKDAETSMELVVSRGGGTIQGKVEDSKHNPVRGTRLTLIPDSPRRSNLLLYKSTASSATGTFTLNGLAPGSYKLFAWEHYPGGAELDPEFIRDYDTLGVSINVTPGLALANIQVTVIPAKK